MILRNTILTIFGLLLGFTPLRAQETIDFESFDIPVDSFLNGSDGSGGFTSGNVFLPNTYNPDFGNWSGWAISSATDTLTPGFTNQYSAITGSGFDDSQNYAVSYAFSPSIIRLENEMAGRTVEGLYITNCTYPYLSMRDGDSFTKKFGGVTGDDPDFFLLTIKKYLDGELSQDSVNFYLADFRFEDNGQDYIVDEWTYVDLSVLGAADSLSFSLSSSDVGEFGINTPTYFCVDNIATGTITDINDKTSLNTRQIKVYPNPTKDFIQISAESNDLLRCSIFDGNGQLVMQKLIQGEQEQMDLQSLPRGIYLLRLQGQELRAVQVLVKE